MEDIDLVEVIEVFGQRTLQVIANELNLGLNKLKVNGAMGHLSATSGARITAHLAHQFRRRRKGPEVIRVQRSSSELFEEYKKEP